MAHTPVLDTFRLDGKIALITGGARGLGKTMAGALAEAGADVALVGRTIASCEEAAKEIAAASGQRAQAFEADVTKAEDVARLAAEVQGALGPVDILFNNAGINIRGPIHELSEAEWDSVVDTNLKGPFLVSRALGPGMAERGFGRIVNMGSILSVISIPGHTPYASSKSGVLGLTRTLALEWAGTGVTVNAICPGPFGTEMNRSLLDDPEKYKEFVRAIPMGRWGEPEELAGVAVLLASRASSFMTGSAIFVDGGWTAR